MRVKRSEQNLARKELLEKYLQTFSIKEACEATAKKFDTTVAALRMDWYRNKNWPREIFDCLRDPGMIDFYLLGIHRTLSQIEKELATNTNPSCRVGLIRTKADILFKLIEIQKNDNIKDLTGRVESLEAKLQALESDRIKRGVK